MSNEKILVLGIGTTGGNVIDKLSTLEIENFEFLTVKEYFSFVTDIVIPKIKEANVIFIVGEVFFEIQKYIVLHLISETAKNENTSIFGIFTENTSEIFMLRFLVHADGILTNNSIHEIVTCFIELITRGELDFMKEIRGFIGIQGQIYFGSAWVRNKNRIKIAAYEAMKSLPPYCENMKTILIVMFTGSEITSDETSDAVSIIKDNSAKDATIHSAHIVDKSFGDMFQIKIFAC